MARRLSAMSGNLADQLDRTVTKCDKMNVDFSYNLYIINWTGLGTWMPFIKKDRAASTS